MLFKKRNAYNKFWNQPDNTEDIVRIENIDVPDCYEKNPPKQHKIKKVEEAYILLGHLDKPITVVAETNERGNANKFILVDEYSRYKFAKDYGMNKLPVRYVTMEEYINLNAIKEKAWHEYIHSKIEARLEKKRNIRQ